MIKETRKHDRPIEGSFMAMPQRDNNIEQIHRLEGLIAYAEEQKDWDEVERLKEQFSRLLERM